MEKKQKYEMYEILNIREHPAWKDKAALWFHEKWNIPEEEYRKSMEECLKGQGPVPQWYVAAAGEEIIGGLGVIENDFHDRKDLAYRRSLIFSTLVCTHANKYTDYIEILSFLTVIPHLFLQLNFTVFFFGLYLRKRKDHTVQQAGQKHDVFVLCAASMRASRADAV